MTTSTLPHVTRSLPARTDLDGWARWLDARRDDVHRVISYALPDPATAEDLVQDTLIAAWNARGELEPGRDPEAWLRAVARNAARKELRRRAREQHRIEVYADRVLERLADEQAFDGRDAARRDALARCREQLGPAAMDALELRYRDGLDFGRIADRTGRTLAAARQLLTRTRAQLRECILRRLSSNPDGDRGR